MAVYEVECPKIMMSFRLMKKTLKSDQNTSRYYSKASFHHFVDEKNYLNFLIYKSLIVQNEIMHTIFGPKIVNFDHSV